MKFLSNFRKRKGLTQSELADMVGVSLNSIARYEQGEVTPSANIAHSIANVLGCTEAELLNGVQSDKAELVISWDWEDMKKGEMNMEENKFKLVLGEDGQIGINGIGKLTSYEAIDEFLMRVRKQLEIALDTQIRRGAIPQNA